MSPLPSVTVAVTHHNGKDLIRDCVESLRRLDYPRDLHAVLVVDDASRDGSPAYIRERFPEVKLVVNEKNQGFTRSVNRGVREAETEWVVLLNNDMRVAPDWLKHLMEPGDPGSGTIVVASKIYDWEGEQIQFQGASINFMGQAFENPAVPGSREEIHEAVPLAIACGGAMAVHRETFLALGGFDEDYFCFLEDADFSWRLRLLGYQIRLAPGAKAFHKGHMTFDRRGKSRRFELLERNAFRQIVKNYGQDNYAKVIPAALLLAIKRSEILEGKPGPRGWKGWLSGGHRNEGILEAYGGLTEHLGAILERRKVVQGMRKVPDREILTPEIFPTPFRPWWLDEPMRKDLLEGGYERMIREVAEAFGIRDIFPWAP